MNRSRTTTTVAAAVLGIAAGAFLFTLAPDAVAGSPGANVNQDFQITTVQLSTGSTATVKYNSNSGKAWVLRNDRLIPIADLGPLSPSNYVVHVTCNEKGRWSAVRLDADAGNLWHVQDGAWVELNEIGTPVSAVQE